MPRNSRRSSGCPGRADPKTILPRPREAGGLSLETCLARRRSVREFGPAGLSESHLAQLAWAAQGVTEPSQGLRTAPSAGALYPLRLYLVTREGVHRYVPEMHALEPAVHAGDLRAPLAAAALGQDWLARAPLVAVVTAVHGRLRRRYGERAERYACIEVGHAAQNVHLEAVALGLVSTPVGAFDDGAVADLLDLSDAERPLYLIAVGHPPGVP